MPKYKIAPDEVVELVEEIRDLWHEHLEFTNIGILMRAEAPRSKGMVTMGAVKRAPEELRVYGKHIDVILWLAGDVWETLTEEQRRALVDHELCHLRRSNSGDIIIVGHDFEEFNAVIRRHGLWWQDAETTIEAFQPHLDFMREVSGRVEALDPDLFNVRDVLEQVDGVLDGSGGDGA